MKSRVALLPVVALVLAGVNGCALAAGSGLSPHAARDMLYRVLDDTQAELGGTWQNQDDPTPRGCVFPLWTEGTHYPALRIGSAPTDSDALIRRTSRLWHRLGYSLETNTIGSVVEVTGRSSLGRLLVLRVGRDSMTLQGDSECRPG